MLLCLFGPKLHAGEPGSEDRSPGLKLAPGLTLGGYATLQWVVPRSQSPGMPPDHDMDGPQHHPEESQVANRSRLNLSHLSAMLWWEPAANWKALAEIDYQDALQIPAHQDDIDGPGSSAYLALERAYLDYRPSDAMTLRLGKFLTPIGRWNQEHSDPLTWTTLRPLISQSAFPTNATGAMLFGTLPLGPQGLDYQVFASGQQDWRSSPRQNPFSQALGLRIAGALSEDLQWGFSASRFVEQGFENDNFRLLGVDMSWMHAGMALSAEAIVRQGRQNGSSTERGGFVQLVLPLSQQWFAVGRLESYKRAEDKGAQRSALLGLVFRGGRHWVGKAEWVQVSPAGSDLPQGLLASLTWQF